MEQVDRFLDWGCDVLCVNMVDRTAAAVIVDKAEEAGVPVIFFNRQPVEEDLQRWEKAYYVGPRGEQSGIFQGQIVWEQWQGGPGAGGPERGRCAPVCDAGGGGPATRMPFCAQSIPSRP